MTNSDDKKGNKIPVVVVYRVSERAKTPKMVVFMNHIVDDIITTEKRKPLLPYEYVFDEVGIGGETLIAFYKKKYKIKNHEIVN
jgi:hypothetical protein